MKKKFLFITTTYSNNLAQLGKGNYHLMVLNLALELGYDVTLAVLDYDKKKTNDKLKLPKQIKVYYYTNFLDYLKLLIEGNFSVIFSNARTFRTLAIFPFGKKNVFMSHNYPLPKKWYQRMFFLFCIKRFNFIRTSNPAEKEILVKAGIKENKIIDIPLCVDFSEKESSSAQFNKYKLDPNKTLLFFCNIRLFKDPETVLKAFKIVLEKKPRTKLIFAGKDMLKEEGSLTFKEMAEKLGVQNNIIQLGYVGHDDIRSLFRLSKTFVVSSKGEGQCLVAYEAAKSGLNLCLSNIPSFNPVFNDCCLFHDVGDYKKLATNIVAYFDNPGLRKKHLNNLKKTIPKFEYDVVKRRLREELFSKF